MPQIIVSADGVGEERSVMLRERVNVADFESDRFAANLVERLGWAVLDAAHAEREDVPAPAEPEPQEDAPRVPRRFERRSSDDRLPQPA